MSNVKFNPTEGENDKLVSVFSEINEGLDTTLNYTISDEGNKAKKSIVVNQVGKREKFLSKKGEGSEPFVLSDGNTFNVLKEGASAIGIKSRVVARFGGYAYNGFCSPRHLHAHYAVSGSYRTYCGLAQLLLDVGQPQV